MFLELRHSFACVVRLVWRGFDIVSRFFIEFDLNIGFPVFSYVTCLGMSYRGYGCIPYFIPKIPVYGTLVFEFVSGVWGFKSVL